MYPQLIPQLQILLCIFRLPFQGPGTGIQLTPDIPDTHQIVRSLIQLAFRFILPGTEPCDTGSFLKDFPAVGALGGKNFIYTALSNDGIAIMTQTGIHKYLPDIPQTYPLAVEVIFTFTGAEIFPCHHDFCGIHRELSGGIVQNQCNPGCTHGAAFCCTAKDNILHLGTSQALGGLLAQYPADGI